jgi:hypothetical protein
MSLLDAALQYAAQGWWVFPCKPGEKVPIGGRGHLDASIDPAQITAWWRATPQANIGVAVAPSNLVVLDVDTAEGKPGLASLREIDAHIPDTKTARTGRGGYHGVFVRPPDMPPQRRIGFKPGLDLLGDGYFVAAPSVLSNGTQYRWERSVPPAPLPQVLRDIAAAPRTPRPGPARSTPRIGCGSSRRSTTSSSVPSSTASSTASRFGATWRSARSCNKRFATSSRPHRRDVARCCPRSCARPYHR